MNILPSYMSIYNKILRDLEMEFEEVRYDKPDKAFNAAAFTEGLFDGV